MLIGGYKIRNQAAPHFLTLTVVEWVDVFTRELYRSILLDSLRHCQQYKGLRLHAWCLMSNHFHIVAAAKNKDLSDVLRDFKKFTANRLLKAIRDNQKESRRKWMLQIFAEHGNVNLRNCEYQFWRQDNHPEELYSGPFAFQKIDYIHNNPVEAGIVSQPWEYLYNSARDYHYGKKCGLLDVDFLI
ncbi:MAG: transposase [Citrobacter freundii]|nr:MAG: transposase [Citrobacter freundii]